jgi:uncharacterized protein (TIGR04255 family)
MARSMLEQLQLDPVERIVFEQPPLVLALCQIRFTPILSVTDPVQVAPIQRGLYDHYPLLEELADSIELQLPGLQVSSRPHGSGMKRWKFRDASDDWNLILSTDFVSLETRQYNEFGDFLDRLREALDALVNTFQKPVGTRIGLRYINEIRDIESYSGVVRNELLGPLAVPQIAEGAREALQQVVMTFSGGQGISFRHGWLAGTTVQPRLGERPPDGPFYLLDYDAYQEFPHLSTAPMDPSYICDLIKSFHEAIHRLFRWSVTSDYVSSLGVRNDV